VDIVCVLNIKLISGKKTLRSRSRLIGSLINFCLALYRESMIGFLFASRDYVSCGNGYCIWSKSEFIATKRIATASYFKFLICAIKINKAF